jgi:hypothetical protein
LPRPILIAVLIVAGLAAAGGAWWVWGPGSGESTGTMVVESDPPGAELVVDGKNRGKTPATLTLPAGIHRVELRMGGSTKSLDVKVPPSDRVTERVLLKGANDLGGLRIATQPSGSTVILDGQMRGTSPVRITDLAPGQHLLVVDGPWGLVERDVTVEPGKVSSLTIPVAGWVRLRAPVSLQVSEQGRSFGSSADGPVMVPSGRHHFDLVNQEVALRLRQFVDVPPGEVVNVPVDLPTGMVNLDADQAADVLIDGRLVGETPLTSIQVPLGPHEVVFRNKRGGEVSYSINVTLTAPVRLMVTFAKR